MFVYVLCDLELSLAGIEGHDEKHCDVHTLRPLVAGKRVLVPLGHDWADRCLAGDLGKLVLDVFEDVLHGRRAEALRVELFL